MRHDWHPTDSQGHYNECPECGATYSIWESEAEGTPVDSECPGTLKGVVMERPVFVIDLLRNAPPRGFPNQDATRFGYARTLTEAKALLQRAPEYGYHRQSPLARIEAHQMNEPHGAHHVDYVFWFTWDPVSGSYVFSDTPARPEPVQVPVMRDFVPDEDLPF